MVNYKLNTKNIKYRTQRIENVEIIESIKSSPKLNLII